MTQKKHINFVSNKLRTVYFLIYKASSILEDKSLNIIYISLFYPHIDYCCEVWGNIYTINIQYLLQKGVIQNITYSKYLTSANERIKPCGNSIIQKNMQFNT